MIARGQPILAADLAPLATLANANLLPLVNALITSGDWPKTPWDVSITPPPSVPPLLEPQAAFAFDAGADDWSDQMARMRTDLITLFTGKKADGVTPLNAGAFQSSALLTSRVVVGVNDPATFPAANRDSKALDPTQQGILFGSLLIFIDELHSFRSIVFRNVSFIYALEDAPDTVTITGKLNGIQFGTWSTQNPVQGLHLYSDLARIDCGDPSGQGDVQWSISPATVKGIWIANTFPLPALNRFIDQDIPPFVGRYVSPQEWSGTGGLNAEQGTVAIGAPAWSGLLEAGLTLPALDNPPAAGSRADVSTTHLASSMRQENLIQTGTKEFTLDLSGYPLYSDTATYGVNVSVKDALGNLWLSLQPGNYNHPLVEGLWWHLIWPAGTEIATGPKYNLIGQSGQCKPASWLVRRDTDFVPWNLGFNPDDQMRILTQPSAAGVVAKADGTPWSDAFPSISNVIRKLSIQVLAPGTANPGYTNGQFQYGSLLTTPLLIFVRSFAHSGAFNPADPTTYDFVTTTNQVNVPGDGGNGFMAKLLATETIVGAFSFYIAIGIPLGVYNADTPYQLYDLVTDPANPANTYKYINANPSSRTALTDGAHWAATADVPFDLITQWCTSPNPRRGYFPFYSECYSFIPTGALWGSNSTLPNQPVPQNGYVIYKVRATRLPVTDSLGLATTPTNGQEIVVTLGQNRMQLDGTLAFVPFLGGAAQAGAGDDFGGGAGGFGGAPLTITIAATARDSGDVDVWIPVLGGNELVFRTPQADRPALFIAPPTPVGLIVVGNIDINHRPVVFNADGTVSTVFDISFEEDGLEVLIPKVVGDTILSDAAAIAWYQSSHQHLGKFDNVDHCNAYAVQLHDQQAMVYAAPLYGAIGVIIESWSHWQPKFTARAFAAFRDLFGTYQAAEPLLLNECLLFKNAFDPRYANYAELVLASLPAGYTEFLLPPTVEVHDDLYAALETI